MDYTNRAQVLKVLSLKMCLVLASLNKHLTAIHTFASNILFKELLHPSRAKEHPPVLIFNEGGNFLGQFLLRIIRNQQCLAKFLAKSAVEVLLLSSHFVQASRTGRFVSALANTEQSNRFAAHDTVCHFVLHQF